MAIADRFRGFLPVVIDIETGGFNADTDAILEIAAITVRMDEQGWLKPDQKYFTAIEPFEGANIEGAKCEHSRRIRCVIHKLRLVYIAARSARTSCFVRRAGTVGA